MPDQQIEMTRGVRQTSVRDALNVLFRHKWKIAIFFLAVFGTVAVLTPTVPNSYTSNAKLLVRIGRESIILDPTATIGPTFEPSGYTRGDEIATEIEILKSQAVARRVIDAVGPEALKIIQDKLRNPILSWMDQRWPSSQPSEKNPDTKDASVAGLSLMKNLSAEVSTNAANFIELAYEAPDPKFAQQVLGKTIEAYLVEHVAVHRTPGSYEFFVQQFDLTKKRMDTLVSELEELKKKGDVSSIDDQIPMALARGGRLNEEITRIESTMAASVARITKLKAALEGMQKTMVASTTKGQNPIVDSLRISLNALKVSIEGTTLNYEENSRQVQSQRRQIEKADELLKQEQPTREQITEALNGTRLEIEQLLQIGRAHV